MIIHETDQKTRENDASIFRRVCGRWSTGVAIVTAFFNGEIRACTISSVQSLSSDPMLVGISLRKTARMAAFLAMSQRFGISILSCYQENEARHFSGETAMPVQEFQWITRRDHEMNGNFRFPVIPGALAHLIGDILQVVETGDHQLFIAEIHYQHYTSNDRTPPLIHFRGNFHTLTARL